MNRSPVATDGFGAVSVSGLTKCYGATRALDDVTLSVARGQIYGLVGLNGAGKTTLIRLMLGMIRPTSGTVLLGGRPPRHRSVRASIGYLVETPSAYPELTVTENLEVARRLHQLADPSVVDGAIALTGLGPYANRRARTLSLGNAQRLGLARALLHKPSVLILDEPVNGLDPAGVVEIRALLVDLARKQGTTIVVSSHLLSEVARVADRIGVLHQGRLIAEIDEWSIGTAIGRRLEVEVADGPAAVEILARAGFEAEPGPGGLALRQDRALCHPELVATTLVEGGQPPHRLAPAEDDLEHWFLQLVARSAGASS